MMRYVMLGVLPRKNSRAPIFKYWGTINPKESLAVGEAYITVPHGVSEVLLDWHISTAEGNASGQLKVRVKPSMSFDTIVGDRLAGKSIVEGKVIME